MNNGTPKKSIKSMDSTSMDIVADNISKLKELFPEAFTEGKVDFDALKEVLGDYIDGREERYSLTWNGKSKARMLAQTPSTGTLRPCKEESVDWNKTQNLFIEGDNLEVLKLLQKSYHKRVKMIYIDPPYNTGNDFVYKDNFKDNIRNYKEITGQVDGDGRNISSNPETSGRYHTDWLNMMYPRLKLARNFLKDDGVIFVSIGENEQNNLCKLLDEIFGEENRIAIFIWKKKAGGGDDSGHVAIEHEYVFCYAKNSDELKLNNIQHESPAMTAKYNRKENGRRYYLERLDKTSLTYSTSMDYPIECPDGSFISPPQPDPSNPTSAWRWGKGTVRERYSELEFLKDKTTQVWRVYTRTWESLDGVTPRSLLVEKYHGRNREGTRELSELIGSKVFNNPKPTKLLNHLIGIGSGEDGDILLDFFAGSCSLYHAAQLSNLEDGLRRNIISVQLPELTGRKDYKTITAIGKERIRRVGTKIKEEKPDYQGDLGFKVFKLDSTNIQPWELDFNLTEQDLEDQISNIKHGRKEEDVLYEVLLKYGLDLTLPITELSVAGHKVFDIGMGALMICLSDNITTEVAEGIARLKDELNPEIMRVVFKDTGFKDCVVKTNAVQILKQAGIEDVRSL